MADNIRRVTFGAFMVALVVAAAWLTQWAIAKIPTHQGWEVLFDAVLGAFGLAVAILGTYLIGEGFDFIPPEHPSVKPK